LSYRYFFVVVLLLGNWRSGLVVASVIPLCLLFAVDEYFGIDANLMSLGAIDFGIIIDGAVIIVEFIAFQIASKAELGPLKEDRQIQIDQITYNGASKMMNGDFWTVNHLNCIYPNSFSFRYRR
jgi:cobalt-zinc-cadmium resistance protein CzcA